MTFRSLHAAVAVAGIALAGSVAWWYQNGRDTAGGPSVQGPQSGAAPAAAGSGPTSDAVVTVEVGKVEAVTLEEDAQAVGTVQARQGVMVRPEVSGRIVQLGFADGQRIRRGQLLVQLDDTLQQAQLKQALAQAGIARTNLERSRELLAQNFVSRSAVDQNQAALAVAEAQVALARAQLARMRIVAPFDGVAGIRHVNVGDYVKDGADIVQIEDNAAVWIDFRLPERFIARVRQAQAVEVSLDALPGQRHAGRVEALDSLVDADGRSLRVRARLDNPDGTLRSGMFARTRIVFASRAGALVVPEEALVPLGGKRYLVKVVHSGNGPVSQRLEAKVGMRLHGKVEILEGVAPGDIVVTAGHGRLMQADGVPLKVVEVGRTSAASAPGPV